MVGFFDLEASDLLRGLNASNMVGADLRGDCAWSSPDFRLSSLVGAGVEAVTGVEAPLPLGVLLQLAPVEALSTRNRLCDMLHVPAQTNTVSLKEHKYRFTQYTTYILHHVYKIWFHHNKVSLT